ncbi:MAG: VOC family protein [Gemmatimonadaceae bacterium]
MGVSRQNIFGNAPGPQPAEPGTYGESPAGFRLPDSTTLGAVKLQVADLGRSLEFYETVLGLRVTDKTAERATLSPHGQESVLIELHRHPGARPVPRGGRLGLYHFAILMPDRPSLGRLIGHLGTTGVRVGSADHLVSESLYLQDPDNLGIEVYADRPRTAWRRAGRELMMATDPLDLRGLIDLAGGSPWTGMPAGTTMGHVHLHVGDIPAAAAFYSGALGFDKTVWHYPGALFLAAGGYHHHLGTNTWAGPGASPASQNEARLLEWTIHVPDDATLMAARESLERSGYPVVRDDGSIVTRDPWETPLRLTKTHG